MFKKVSALGLLSAAVLGSVSLPAHADQVNTQNTDQNAATIGDYNRIRQNSEQFNMQKREGFRQDGYYPRQDNFQGTRQNAGAVGDYNRIRQDSRQYNEQREKAPKFDPRSYQYYPNNHDD